jgi:dTMP kinase
LHICFEGIDGCGSTTHSGLLSKFLTAKGFRTYLTKEPSNTEIGLVVRKFLKNENIHPSTDALLFAADRSHHFFNEIKQKLEDNYVVISDRFLESSIVYQSAQSELISIEWVKTLNKFIEEPEITIILDIPPKISLQRKKEQILEKFENITFLSKVRDIYLKRAEENNYYVINSDEKIELVQIRIQKIVMNELKKFNFEELLK